MRPRRFDIRKDREGWTVYDVFTGETVVLAGIPQTGMSREGAKVLIELLDRPSMKGRPLWQ